MFSDIYTDKSCSSNSCTNKLCYRDMSNNKLHSVTCVVPTIYVPPTYPVYTTILSLGSKNIFLDKIQVLLLYFSSEAR